MTPLERGQLGVMRLQAVISAVMLSLAAGAAALALQSRFPAQPIGLFFSSLLLLFGYTILVAPLRRYRAWGYQLADEELRVMHGVWTRVETHVPLARVQHVDVSQGPIERAFGVCRLLLNTAGTINATVTLPGLSRATAEAIRDEARARIRAEDA